VLGLGLNQTSSGLACPNPNTEASPE
jgi:hypothetical protein